MPQKITRETVESYFLCAYKGHLTQTRQQGVRSDYETLLMESRGSTKLAAISKLLTQCQSQQSATGLPLTVALLKQGLPLILETQFEDDLFSLSFDGLKKVAGQSKLGDFHYVPILFHNWRSVQKEQRQLLELYGLLLYRLQGVAPSSGVVWAGRESKAVTIRLNVDLQKGERLLEDLSILRDSGSPPKLMLNEHCQICEFHQRCRDQAVKEDHLSLLRGMSEKEIKKSAKKGIFTVTQLAHTFRPRRKGKRESETTKHYHSLQALAIRDKKIYVMGQPELPSSPVQIYWDVESDPDANFIYLIGMIVVENGLEMRHSFWADQKDQEAKIFEQFVAEVSRHEKFSLFCYGGYELAYLKRMRKAAKRKKLVDKIINSSTNILSIIYSHIYFPTYSNSLNDVARFLGFSWSEPKASGIQSIVWRKEWEATHGETFRRKLTTYNLEDCAALKKTVEVIQTVANPPASDVVPPSKGESHPTIEFVKEVEKLSDFHTWGKVNFVHSDYEYVNKCAYFDYQRERVYVRTNKALRKNKARKKNRSNRKLKGTKKVEITASKCPSCKSNEVIRNVKKEVRPQEPRVKKAFDLVVTSSGIRRKIFEIRTSAHKCLSCGQEFIPHQHQRLDKHFHGLKSWAIYQHVEYRIPLVTTGKMIGEFFGIRIFRAETHMFKSLMARYYKETYRGLLKKILSGNLLHVDETEVKLQHGKGYVWVFTNLEEVVYMYKPTREGSFLHEFGQS